MLFGTRKALSKATELYAASQNKASDLKDVLTAQRQWQDYLAEANVPQSLVYSFHRSFGLEYEFANWSLLDKGAPVVSHTEVGKSAPFSALLGVPFILETDANEELEMVAPPLLAGDETGGVDKAFIKSVHTRFITGLTALRNRDASTPVQDAGFEGLGFGKSWAWGASADRLAIAKGENKKWKDKGNQIGYQLNLAMRPSELAAESTGDGGLKEHDKAYADAKKKLDNVRTSVLAGAAAVPGLDNVQRSKALEPVLVLFAKGLSNFVAIPTIAWAAEHDHKNVKHKNDLHSHVKDLHSFWIKDSIQNTVMSAVREAGKQASADLKLMIDSGRLAHPLKGLSKLVPDYGDGPHKTGHKATVETAIEDCLKSLKARLDATGDELVRNEKVEFLAEDLSSGKGVRKDTYANIPGNRTGAMHLGEFRSNEKTNAYLG